jgi:hypothetical protein
MDGKFLWLIYVHPLDIAMKIKITVITLNHRHFYDIKTLLNIVNILVRFVNR